MDDVIRPRASAARKAAHALPTDNLTTFIGPDRVQHPDPVMAALLPRRPNRQRSGSPSGRRVTRGETFGEKPALYDMKYHPMDAIMRPAYAKKVAVELSSALTNGKRSPKKGKCIRPTPVVPSARPFTEPPRPDNATNNMAGVAGWKFLDHIDRMIYRFQKGAPPNGNTLPLKWSEALQMLRSAPCVLDSSEKAIQDRDTLRKRYTTIWQGLHAHDNIGVEPSIAEHWTLHYAEDFDVYDYNAGDKYFNHRCQSIVRPALLETASTGNSDDEDHSLNGSLNDEAGYVRQSMGELEGSETEIIASMQNSIPANIDMIGLNELTPMFSSSNRSADDTEKQSDGNDRQMLTCFRNKATAKAKETIVKFKDEPESEEEVGLSLTPHKLDGNLDDDDTQSNEEIRLPFRRRPNSRSTDFSVLEDQPGNTPRIKRMVARNPMSPGTDIPKENLRERSPSEE
ncbi:MAG: hypothetical protein Q9222_005816 [Ikaeria aurantiellina]